MEVNDSKRKAATATRGVITEKAIHTKVHHADPMGSITTRGRLGLQDLDSALTTRRAHGAMVGRMRYAGHSGGSRALAGGGLAGISPGVASQRGHGALPRPPRWPSTCCVNLVENRSEPRTALQWVRYLVVAAIALFLVWWMLRLYVL